MHLSGPRTKKGREEGKQMIAAPHSAPPIPLQARGKMTWVPRDEKNFHPVWITQRYFWRTLTEKTEVVENAQLPICFCFGYPFINPQSHFPRRQDFQFEASRSFENGPAGILSSDNGCSFHGNHKHNSDSPAQPVSLLLLCRANYHHHAANGTVSKAEAFPRTGCLRSGLCV